MFYSLLLLSAIFGSCELVLGLAGVRPVSVGEDPFVGFSGNFPLFVASADGRPVMETANNKLGLFNKQEIARNKAKGGFRIFCVGGSTTFGRPYQDPTSFCGWLREFLPEADPTRQWEVINAGGVSYASYRVARLMEELVDYEPDLFVVYSGQNEFLEERTYRSMKKTSRALQSVSGIIARMRIYSGMRSLLRKVGAASPADSAPQNELPGEVDTLLQHYGPAAYKRDDALRVNVLEHYGDSLKRIVGLSKKAGAKAIFVNPASSLKDCTPFKGEHTPGMSQESQQRSMSLLVEARKNLMEGRPAGALTAADQALALDPRHAELHYRRGQALLALKRFEEAEKAFTQALVEDVCPLRALPSMGETIMRVARETDTPIIDFAKSLATKMTAEQGHPIPGKEYFLDHVHPTIEGHRLLALQILERMKTLGIVTPSPKWGPAAIAAVNERVLGRIDRGMRATSLTNLAAVLAWSGKLEDAQRPALEALSLGVKDPDVITRSATVAATRFAVQGDRDNAWKYFRMALHVTPNDPALHLQIGTWVLEKGIGEPRLGIGHILRAVVYWAGEHRDRPLQMLGRAMDTLGRPEFGYAGLLQAQQINSRDAVTNRELARLRSQLGTRAREIGPAKVQVGKYPSGTIRHIVEVKPTPAGGHVPHGVATEWFETGELKRYFEHVDGRPDGVDLTFAPTGAVLTRSAHAASN